MTARLSEGAKTLGITIEQPDGPVRYRVTDVFTTYNGSWVVGQQPPPYGIELWAQGAYTTPEFDDAGADRHLFGMVLGSRGGKFVGPTTAFSYGTPRWGDGNDALIPVKKHSGWANIALYMSSSFSPERGEQGPWAWHPFGEDSEIVIGGGLPNRHHVSTFAVWQEVDEVDPPVVTPPDGDLEARVQALEQWARGIGYTG